MAEQNVIEEHTEYIIQYPHSVSRDIKTVWYGYEIIHAIKYYLHKDDGPAYLRYFDSGELESAIYYAHNKKHRIDGPAFIGYNRDGTVNRERYYLCNQIVDKDQFSTPGFIDAFILENS